MKKVIAPALAFLAFLSVSALGNSVVNAKAAANANGWDYDSYNPETNEASSFFETCWGNANFTSQRLTEKAAVIYHQPAYGLRGQHRDKFDLTTLEFTLELSHHSDLVLVSLTSTSGGYYEPGNGNLLTMDFVPAVANTIDGTANKYIMTLSSTDGKHNVSINDWNDGGKWADDANFVGVQFTATDNKINVKFEKGATTTDVTVNDITKTVSNSDLFALYDKNGIDYNTPEYFVVGGMNGTGKEKLVIEEVTDAAHKEYYSATGAYGKAKSIISELKDYTVETATQAQAFLAKYNALDMSSLKSYDVSWLNADYQAVVEKYNVAKTLDPTYLLKQKVSEMDAATASLTTKEDISNAEKAINSVQTVYDEVDTTVLDADSKAYYDSVPTLMSDAKAKIGVLAKSLYTAAVDEYVAAVDAIKDADTLLDAKAKNSSIPTSYEKYFSEEDLATVKAKYTAAKEKYSGLVKLNNDNVYQGNNVDVLTLANNELLAVSDGATNYSNKASGNGLYFENPVDYSNFEVKFNVSKMNSDNTWFSLGIMEKKNVFIQAEDDSVTENKGVFFLIAKDSVSTMSVQVFICTLSSTRFYDSKLITTMSIPYQEDVTLKMRNTTKEVGGLTGNYYSISFNDVEYSELITANKLKTVFTEGNDCYFVTQTSGSQVAYSIKSINGKDPLSSDLKPASLVPTTTDTDLEYTLGSEADLKINVDTKGQAISSLKVGKKVIGAQNYSYADGVLTIKATALSKVAEGTQKITLETAFGSLSWNLIVKTSGGSSDTTDTTSETDGKTSSGGCGGSIIATSAIVSTLALAGIGLVFYKKKQDK